MKPPEHEFANLVDELARLLMAEELFTFVLVEGVEPTNNLMERELRNPAGDRNAGRTNKTKAGASSSQCDRQRPGIATSEPGDIHVGECSGGSEALDGQRNQPVRRTMAKDQRRSTRLCAQHQLESARS